MEPVAPFTDPDTGLVVATLDKGRALDLIDQLPCVVHLLKEFRMKRIQELPQLNLHLSGSTDASGNVVGMLLSKIDHGRRGVITLDCRLLCVASSREAGEKLARWEIVRALLIPMASIAKATRVVASVNKNDVEAKKLWADLGFNFVPSDDLHTLNAVLDPIELNITHKPLSRVAAAPAPAPAPEALIPPKTKRGRPSKTEGAAHEVAESANESSSMGQGAHAERRSATADDEAGRPKASRREPCPQQPQPPPPLPSALPAPPAARGPRRPPADSSVSAVSSVTSGGDRSGADSSVSAVSSVNQFRPTDAARLDQTSHCTEVGPPTDDGSDYEMTDVYIRRTCPSADLPHLVRVPKGAVPPQGTDWVQVPEEDLERAQTVQCTQCESVLLLARDHGAAVDGSLGNL
jgi:hypothetical protein